MVLLIVGKEDLAELLKDEMTTGSYGTDGTTPTDSDTSLGAEVAASIKTLSITRASTQLTIIHSLLSTDANGNTFREYGNKVGTTLFNRVSLFDLAKTNAEDFQMTTVVNIL